MTLSTTSPRRPSSRRFRYAYNKLRGWHVGRMAAVLPAIRYAFTGDTGRVRSHGGWYKSRLRTASHYDPA